MHISLVDLTDDADLFVYRGDREPLAESVSGGSLDERIDLTLENGSYFVFVVGRGGYLLNLGLETSGSTLDCSFVLGFADLASLIPDQVGECLDDQSFSPITGDARQPTTGGLLVWRKADNWTVFTDGTSTWLNGPNGLQQRLNDQRFHWEGDAGAYAPAEAPSANVAAADLRPEDLIAASLSPQDMQELFPSAEPWWQAIPFVEQAPFAGNPTVAEFGHRIRVGTAYSLVSETPRDVNVNILLFDDPAAAAAGMAKFVATSQEDGVEIDGPAIGDESHYYVLLDLENPDRTETLVRFQSGAVVGRIRMIQDGAESPESLASAATRMHGKLQRLFAGDLTRTPLPADLAALLPTAGPGLGPILSSGAPGPEGWALIDTANDPPMVLERLRSLGATQLATRSFTVVGSDTHIIELTLFPFRDEAASSDWFDGYLELFAPEELLSPGMTGPRAGFTQGEFGLELQFAKGRYVADVFCYAPFDATSAETCEAPTRALAEQWYALLPE